MINFSLDGKKNLQKKKVTNKRKVIYNKLNGIEI